MRTRLGKGVIRMVLLFAVGAISAPAVSWACSCMTHARVTMALRGVDLIEGLDGDVSEEELAEEAFWGERAGMTAVDMWTLSGASETYLRLQEVE